MQITRCERGTIIEMPKESESCNKKDNSSSEMIVMTPNPRVEEVLISDQHRTSTEALTYETRLNEKLKDLDLYEEDMTIQQKEELLEVVVASWETAEKEKTRRQFFQDYMTASEAFCNDQFEFTLQESEEISNAIRCADIPLPPDPPQPSISGFSGGFGSGAVTVNGNFDMQFDGIASTFDSAEAESKNEKAFPQISVKTSNESDSYDIRESKSKMRSPRRGRSRRGRAKETLGVSGVVSSHSVADGPKKTSAQEVSAKQPLEKSISLWKPCLSPKDTPLTCSRRPMPEEKDASSYIYSEEEYSQKVFNLVKEFDFAQRETRKACAPKRTYGKPYHLTRRGLFVKKSGKLDKYDTMIGVSDTGKHDQSDPGFVPHSMTKGEPFSRTSEGAHRYTKSNRSETVLTQTNTPVLTTRSGVRYGFQRTAAQDLGEVKEKPPEAESVNELLPQVSVVEIQMKDLSASETIATPVQRYLDKDALFDSLLPKYNNTRTDVSVEASTVSNGPSQRKKGHCKSPASSKTKSCPPSSSSASQNHIVNSCVDSDSSDNSSVIDVETVVDDEINEFVLKRKMLQNYSNVKKDASSSKRAKKGSV